MSSPHFLIVALHLPFLVTRSRFDNLPVYTDYRKGRTKVLTKITNIRGDIEVAYEYRRVQCVVVSVIYSYLNTSVHLHSAGNYLGIIVVNKSIFQILM